MRNHLTLASLCALGVGLGAAAHAGEVRSLDAVGHWYRDDDQGSFIAIPTHRSVLPSGLQVVVQPDSSTDVVTFSMVIDAGRAQAGGEKGELAHLVEHLWFESTDGDGVTVQQRLDLLGCDSNAATYVSHVNYWAACPATAFESIMELQGRLLVDPLAGVTAPILDGERAVVRAEQRYRGERLPWTVWASVIGAALPSDHVLAPLGTQRRAQLEALDLGQAQAFVQRAYRPDRATLYVGGNVGAPLVDGLDHVVSRLPAAARGEELPYPALRKFRATGPVDVPALPGPQEPITLGAPVPKRLLMLAWTAPGSWRASDTNLHMLPILLERRAFPVDSRRGRDARVSCDVMPAPEISIIHCSTWVDEGVDADALAERLLKQTFRVRGSDAQDQHTSLAIRHSWMGRWQTLLSAEDLSHQGGRADLVATHAHMTGRATWVGDAIRAGRTTRWEVLEAWSRDILARERAIVIHVLPDGEATFDGASDRHADRSGRASDSRVPDDLSASVIKERATSLRTSRMQSETLDNGLRVVAIRHRSLPGWVSAGLALRTGDASPTTFALDVINAAHSPVQPRFVGVTRVMEGPGWTGQLYTGNSDRLADVLQALQPPEMSPLYTRRLARAAAGHAARTARRALWAHDLSPQLSWISEDSPAVRPSPRDVIRAGRQRYRPDNATLVIVGDIDPSRAIELVQRSVHATWKAQGKAQAPPVAQVSPARPTAGSIWVRDRAIVQSRILWTCRLPNLTLDDRSALEVGTEWARQRLWRRFRTERGWSYGVHARTQVGPAGDGVLQLWVDAPAERVPDILTEVERTLAGQPEPDQVLGIAYELGLKYALRTQTHAELMIEVIEPSIAGADLQWHAKRSARLAGVGPDDLQRVLDGCVGRHTIELTGRESEITPVLDEAGMEWLWEPTATGF